MDLKAINHVLMDSQTYEKPAQSRFFLSKILGDGAISHGIRNVCLTSIRRPPY